MDLALTLDYELFGNGSGDVFKNVIDPTKKLLSLFDRYNIKITIFFEVVEYWKIMEEWEKGNTMGYENNPAEAMKIQMIEAFKNGHDIQLHIHPQWINARYENKWLVDKYWCMKDIPMQANDTINIDLFSVVKKGRDTLEEWLRPINPLYSCNIFRAGAFNILPSERIFPILADLGFVADSSVFPGGYEINDLSNIDFRNISNRIPYWTCDNYNINNQSSVLKNGSLIELPIFSYPLRRILKYDLHRIFGQFLNINSSFETINNRLSRISLSDKAKFLLEKEYLTWDFCLFNKRKWRLFYNRAMEISSSSKYEFHPFILIGHSKSYFNTRVINNILDKIISKTSFHTLNEIFDIINAKIRDN